jgi:hypothetical protein
MRLQIIIFGLLLCGETGFAQTALALPSADEAVRRCESLTKADFSTTIDAPTQISDATHIETLEQILGENETIPAPLKAVLARSLGKPRPMCLVRGYVAPNVGFTLTLPDSNWNGKFLHLGCFGWCGDASWSAAMCSLHPDYACIGTDMGHRGEGGLWLRNNPQGQIDFSYRATHVVTIAGKALVAHFYGHNVEKAYFMGCSTGGYQGMIEAQRFPWDFDGIIAGAPDMDQADLAVRGIWLKQHYLGSSGEPLLNASELSFVHEAALARCDRDDGIKDGVIGNPTHCAFNVAELECHPGQTSACLTRLQTDALRAIYGSATTSRGETLSTRGVLPGSELNWAENFADVWGEAFFHDTALLTVPGKAWTFKDFDFDLDYPRSGAGVLFADTNPDLRKFNGAGGKLISYQGGNDAAEIPGAVIDYYETVERTMGGRAATQNFFRLFVIPGMNHCGGGDGVFAFDYLSYLEAWVERGQAPDRMVGAHPEGLGKFDWVFLKYPLDPLLPVTSTRPVFPYPAYAKYKGKGDPNSASSFEAEMP